MIASFFKRLVTMAAIIRVVLNGAKLSAALTFKGDAQKKVLFDFSKSEACVELDKTAQSAHIHMVIDADIMHEILLGNMKPGLALGQRRMLLRGSAMNLAKFIPLFDFSPTIYREHLADVGYHGYTRKKETVVSEKIFTGEPIPLTNYTIAERIMIKLINRLAYMLGYLTGVMRHRVFQKLSIFDVLSSMSKGLEAATPKK
jgi:hypothetical protein